MISSVAILSDTGSEGDFPMVPGPGSPPPSGSIQVQNGEMVLAVSFHPTAAGLRTAVIHIAHILPQSAHDMPFGHGIAGDPPGTQLFSQMPNL
jgi:hypothetical protein